MKNYEVTFVSGTFLTVTAENEEVAKTYVMEGLVNGIRCEESAIESIEEI